jgi:predicted nucleotidyltransferase
MSYYNSGITKEKIKSIYNDEYKCITKEEIKIKRLVNSCKYIFNNINQTFREEFIIQSYYLLTNELINNNIVNNLIEIYYKNFDSSSHYLASLIHLFIINQLNNIEYAFIISNLIMLKKERYFLIPYDYCIDKYKTIINEKNMVKLILLFYDIETVNIIKKSCLIIKDEVIEIIKKKRNELIFKYDIDKLYLFGSVSKGNNNEYSDLDFLVVFNNQLINLEKRNKLRELKKYFCELFNSDVDILEFNYALDTFDKSEIENIITLI